MKVKLTNQTKSGKQLLNISNSMLLLVSTNIILASVFDNQHHFKFNIIFISDVDGIPS